MKKSTKFLMSTILGASVLFGAGISTVQAADYKLRAVANSNENDEDYDGLVVFKDFVESRSNGKVQVDLFIGTQLCANGTECLQALEDGSVDIYIPDCAPGCAFIDARKYHSKARRSSFLTPKPIDTSHQSIPQYQRCPHV